MLRKLIIFLICCIFTTAASYGTGVADSFHFTHFKSADGLPHQQIQAMAFDHDGRLWIGTRNGLASYDGYGFTTYYHNPVDGHSLPHNCRFARHSMDKYGEWFLPLHARYR